ncbi:DUF2157 domain-containing protein [Rhodoferax saidenbachensis]|uniref:Membrane protein n=1 Tax=Rhodoferax saidenbachensis TaxID=1484693 RepID=A0ABU1ZPA0_9BURK|nr:DUF2157 domain-containing protein [Rhodoferax saidenbachensis]MDR7306376.1 putative membrane protein [Rhodoferax saidenbachensis]
MNRHSLDTFCQQQQLDAEGVGLVLSLSGSRPDAPEWRRFLAQLLRGAGLGALGAGVLFFVAANWQDYGVLGRFVLLQSGLLFGVVVALWRAPPQRLGQAGLLLATLLTGAVLALFGQSYQTGADVHELFFTWAALSLPFALAGRSGALWALWWCVLNVGLALLCGWLGSGHVFWRLLDGWGIGHADLLMLPCLINFAAAAVFSAVANTRFVAAAPQWLVRLLSSFGMAYGTAACIDALSRSGNPGTPVMLVFLLICAAIAVLTWRRRRDVFNIALIAASWIAISTTWLIKTIQFHDVSAFFMVAFWLIGTSTAAGMLLMHWVRAWQVAAKREVHA